MKEYYDRRAPEYDDWWLGQGLFAPVPDGWSEERDELMAALEGLEPKRTLDVACGTGFVTMRLPGAIVGIDQSARMLDVATKRNPARVYWRYLSFMCTVSPARWLFMIWPRSRWSSTFSPPTATMRSPPTMMGMLPI